MAGQPIKRAIVAQLARRAAEMSVDRGEELGPLDVVYEWVATGRKVSELAIDLGKDCDPPIRLSVTDGGGVLTAWVNVQDGGREMLARARADAAHILVEEAQEIVDDVDEDKNAIAKAKLRAEQRQWLAGKWNRPAYGQDAQVALGINLDLGQLHIDALRQRRLEDTPPATAIEGRDYEVVNDPLTLASGVTPALPSPGND